MHLPREAAPASTPAFTDDARDPAVLGAVLGAVLDRHPLQRVATGQRPAAGA